MFVWSKGHELLGVDPLPVGKGQCLLVRKEEAISEAWPDGMAYVALPKHAPQPPFFAPGGILCRAAHGQNTAHADDHPSGLFRQRGSFRVEEAERLLWPESAEKGVEQSKLVLTLLHPIRLHLLALVIADVGLSVRHPADLQSLGNPDLTILRVPLDLLTQHPSEGYAGSGVGRLDELGRSKVAVSLGVESRVRVRHGTRDLEGGHERHSLAHTGWYVGPVELV